MTMDQADVLERRITERVLAETGVLMTGISVYSVNTDDDNAARILQHIRDVTSEYEHVLQIHGFYINETEKNIQFDMIIDFDETDPWGLLNEVHDRLVEEIRGYEIYITRDFDISD